MQAAVAHARSLQLHHQGFTPCTQQKCASALLKGPLLPDGAQSQPEPARSKRQWTSCHAAPSNLGQLSTYQSVVGTEDASAATWSANIVSAESFANRGLYVDMPVVLSSGFLFFVLVAVAFQRVFGLDRLVAQFMLQQQERRRQDVIDARQSKLALCLNMYMQRLEQSWQNQQEGDAGNNSNGNNGSK